MKTLLKTALAAALATAALAASAQPYGDRNNDRYGDRHDRITAQEVDARQARQAQRIERGVARGDLTRQEARTLRGEQHEIARAETAAWADGYLSQRELRRLNGLLDRADDRIQALRQNDMRRPTA